MHILTDMLIVTTDGLPGHEIHEILGEVLGVAQRAHSRSGGSSTEFQVPGTGDAQRPGLLDTRRAAIQQMTQDARQRGANAVIGLAFETVDIGGKAIEVCAYGTAVVAQRIPERGNRPPARPVQSPGRTQPGAPVGRDVTISGPRPTGERRRDTSDNVQQISRYESQPRFDETPQAAPGGKRDVTMGVPERRGDRPG